MECGVEECDDGGVTATCDGSCNRTGTETYLWVSPGSTDWAECRNWLPAGVPTLGDVVQFDGSSSVSAINATTVDLSELDVAASYTGTITINSDLNLGSVIVDGGTLATTNTVTMSQLSMSGAGIVDLTGGGSIKLTGAGGLSTLTGGFTAPSGTELVVYGYDAFGGLRVYCDR